MPKRLKSSARPLPAERLPIRRISWMSALAIAFLLFIVSAVILYKCAATKPRKVATLANLAVAGADIPAVVH